MKYRDSRAAIVDCDWIKQPDGYEEPVLPEDPGLVHAITDDCGSTTTYDHFGKRSVTELTDIDYDSGPKRAACAKIVRVVLPIPFDDEDETSCPRCAESMRLRHDDPAAWQQDQHAMYTRMWKRDEQRHREQAELRAARYRQMDQLAKDDDTTA